jgi:hypothetical protein
MEMTRTCGHLIRHGSLNRGFNFFLFVLLGF